jgi:hypothetical protein
LRVIGDVEVATRRMRITAGRGRKKGGVSGVGVGVEAEDTSIRSGVYLGKR